MISNSEKKYHFTSFQLIIAGFAAVILIGAILLMLPISSVSGQITPFNETLFTSTSAVCVTGLVVNDTATYWSLFGHIVILLLIQIGGLGVITVAASFALLSGRKFSLMQRSTMQEAIAAPQMGGIVKLTGFVLKATFTIELIGALLMLPSFCRGFGLKGIWMSLFHSVSAFCNAGFDILGRPDSLYPSLTAYISDPVINITIMLLIITGGIGFLTWDDIQHNRHHFKKYRMQSKVILVTTALLIIIPAILFFCFEFNKLPIRERLLSSLFQSVTPRTAGFNTVNLAAMSGVSQAVMIILMLIGGSPGSTAGGMKTTTIAVLFANIVAVFKRKDDAEFFGRRLEPSVIRNASAILIMYMTLFLTGAFIISVAEGLPLSVCLYETASAVATVGLTLGITPELGILSQLILITLMFIGRVGGLTLIYAALSGTNKKLSKLPQEKITVG
ncbi:MAG: Trk family potassium uptake protein [Lachnospiraceae bacterium]|nr:Trk family potassium uptake protein [Lachnospiraceae bacterium]